MAVRISLMVAAVLGCLLGPLTAARAQFTAEQYKVYLQLLQEKDGPAAFAKRLQLIGDALDKDALPKAPGSYTSYQTSAKNARVPAADALPFLVKFLDRDAEITKRSALRMLADYGAAVAPVAARIRQLMDDPIRGVREDAMLTLGTIVPNGREVAAAVVARLGAPGVDDSENRAAVRTLILMARAVDK